MATPKRGKQGPADVNEIAFRVVTEATDESKPEAKPARGKAGAEAGGKARATKLTAEQRSEIASVAARARWRKS